MKSFTKILSACALLTLITLTASQSFAAFACPSGSCNPHNGCTDGCSPFHVTGSASCANSTPEQASAQAVANGQSKAYQSCRSTYQVSQWAVYNNCASNGTVTASASFMCLQ